MRIQSRIPAILTRWLSGALLVAAAAALAACGDANGAGGKDDKEAVPAVPVEVAATQRAEMAALYTGTAPVESDRKAFVMPKVQGEIRQVLADEGQRVRAGQTLARLDGDKLRLEVALSEATMRKLERDYNRNLELQLRNINSYVAHYHLRFARRRLLPTLCCERLLALAGVRALPTSPVQRPMLPNGLGGPEGRRSAARQIFANLFGTSTSPTRFRPTPPRPGRPSARGCPVTRGGGPSSSAGGST